MATHTLVGFSGENAHFQDFSLFGITINLYQSVTEKTVVTTEVGIDLPVTIYLGRKWIFSSIFSFFFFCLIISTIDTASCWWVSIQLSDLCVFPQWPRQQRLLPQPQVGHVASDHQTRAIQQVFFTYCWIHVNSYSGPQHDLWDFIQEKSLLM